MFFVSAVLPMLILRKPSLSIVRPTGCAAWCVRFPLSLSGEFVNLNFGVSDTMSTGITVTGSCLCHIFDLFKTVYTFILCLSSWETTFWVFYFEAFDFYVIIPVLWILLSPSLNGVPYFLPIRSNQCDACLLYRVWHMMLHYGNYLIQKFTKDSYLDLIIQLLRHKHSRCSEWF